MARRYYSSTAVATTTTGSLSNSATSITVAALTGYPAQTPWTAVLEPDTVNEEVVEVTNVSSTTLTVTRGVDGTTGKAHDSGVKFQHGVSARDFDEANDHVNDSTGVHGIGAGASVVGTTDTQTLTNKTITFANNTLTGVTPTTRSVSAGSGLTGGGDLSSDRTIAADFATTTAALGSAGPGDANTISRGNHVHAMPSASDVGAVANSLVNAKGDLVTATANDTPAVLTVGANDTVLTADSSTATGLAWKAASGGISNTLLDAKGDLIAASANDTAARLAAGSNGQILMADSSATAGLRYVDPPANRNIAYNGAMQVAQRSSSVTGIGSTNQYNTADRWKFVNQTIGAWTQSVENDAPTGSGLRKSLKMLCTTANAAPTSGQVLALVQSLEGQDLQRIKKGTSSAEQITVSFWVKSNVTGNFVVELRDVDNTRHVSALYTVSASATWEKKTVTFPADTTGAFDNDNAASLDLNFWLGAGSDFTSGTLATTWASRTSANIAPGVTNLAAATNNYWQITGVQLETGPVATPFEFEPYEATLRKCQRYYHRYSPNDAQRLLGMGQCIATTAAVVAIPFPVTMRTRPTALEQSGTAGDYRVFQANSTVQALNAVPTFDVHTTPHQAFVYVTTAGNLAAGDATSMTSTNSSAYLGWSAEL